MWSKLLIDSQRSQPAGQIDDFRISPGSRLCVRDFAKYQKQGNQGSISEVTKVCEALGGLCITLMQELQHLEARIMEPLVHREYPTGEAGSLLYNDACQTTDSAGSHAIGLGDHSHQTLYHAEAIQDLVIQLVERRNSNLGWNFILMCDCK